MGQSREHSKEGEKKARERAQFDLLCELRPELGLRFVDQMDEPAPDIVARSFWGEVGVELTEIRNPDQSAQEGTEKRVVQWAHDHYCKLGGCAVDVRVNLGSLLGTNGSEKRKIAEELAQMIFQWSSESGESVGYPAIDEDSWLARYANIVSCNRSFTYGGEGLWTTMRSAWVRDLEHEDVAERLRPKDGKLAGYRQVTPVVWLAVVLWGEGPSSWLHVVEQKVAGWGFETGFDRVFLIQSLRARVLELRRAVKR